MKKFALAGNPNCGKTTLFNNLTGSTAHVGNWPGVTVDKREGTYKKLNEPISIVDLPGIYSLSPYTPEEVISRNFILDEKPDCVINIIDATNLERNLYLTTQIMEIDVPVVIALNMMDEVEKNGDKIDVDQLSKKIGLPVVAISALKEKGLDELMKQAYAASLSKREGATVLEGTKLMHLINDCKIGLKHSGVDNALFHAVKLAELDELEVAAHPDSAKMVEEFKATFKDDVFGADFEAIVADARYKYISKNYSHALTKRDKGKDKVTKSDKADKVLTHRIWGIPIFLVILFFVFHLTFSEDLFYLGKMGVFDKAEEEAVQEEEVEYDSAIEEFCDGVTVESFFGLEEGFYSPGVFLQSTLGVFTDLIGACLSQALANAAPWVSGIIVDGIWAGLASVLSFLPQILLLFLFFSILEDSGYMARVAFILDRIFRRFGLSGRAFMPMIMGFGCSIPAMINTRTLADQNERTATIRVIPFFSCGAKLPILTAIAGGIVTLLGMGNADLITYGMYLLGVVVAIAAVILMRSTTMRGEVPPFIMELPAYHAPQFKNLMLHLWDKTKHFIKKAFTIILASTIFIWFVSHFSWNWQYLEDEQINNSILAGIGGLIQPLFTPLGFGSQLGINGWVFVVAAVTGLIAKENVIATFGTLGACLAGAVIDVEVDGGIAAVSAMIAGTGIHVPGLLAFIAFNMLTIPCFAAVATAKAELPNKKSFRMTLLFWVVTSYLVSCMIYLIGTWWWTVFIFAALWAAAITCIVLYNKGKIDFNKLKIAKKKE
ncbi:MAG: ferrous iron transporter B [Clostridia bacterium]|nr:ferrous iron transporter B [Clostridia bacterium]